MQLRSSLRSSAYLCAYGSFFLLSFLAPFHFAPRLMDSRQPQTRSWAPSVDLCGLAALPVPRPTAAPRGEWLVQESLIPEQILLRLDTLNPPLASMAATGPQLSTLAAIPEPPGPVIEAPPVPSLPAVNLPAAAGPATAIENESPHWQPPVSLLAQLERLSQHAATSGWATRVADDIRRITSTVPMADPDRRLHVASLRQAAGELETLVESVADADWAANLRRAGYGLLRRVDLWQAALDVEGTASNLAQVRPEPQRLAQCMADVDQLMQGDAGKDWRNYLMLEALGQLAGERCTDPSADDRSLARRVLVRLDYARHLPGQQPFVSSGPLAVLDEQLRVLAAEPIDTTLLLARLEQYEATGQASIGSLLAEDRRRLAFSPQPECQLLASRIEEHYRNCNLRVAVGQEMLNRALPAQQPTEAPVRDVILGIPVRGRSTTTNELTLRLLPSSERLRLEITAKGHVQSTTTSDSGAVEFNSRSNSTYTAHKVLEFGSRKVESQPAVAEAETSSKLRSVQSDYDNVPVIGSLVQDYAMDRYRDRREAARQEVQRKVSTQARQKLDKLAETGFQAAHQRFVDQVMVPLDRLALEPSYTESRTDEKRFTVRTRLASTQHLAANTPRPRALSDSLLSVQIHESAANNLLDRLDLAGRTFTAAELRQHLGKQLNLSKPIQPSTEDDYSVTFAEVDAVQVRLREGRAELTLNIAQLESGSRTWRNFTVQAKYRAEAVGNSVELVRDGTLALFGERLGMQSQFVLRGVFGRIFSEDRRVTWLSDLMSTDKRLAGLQVTQLVIEDGWLGLAIGPHRPGGEVALGR